MKIAVVGAGNVGATIARLVAERFSRRRMIEGYERLFLDLAGATFRRPGAAQAPQSLGSGSRTRAPQGLIDHEHRSTHDAPSPLDSPCRV